MTTAEAKVGMRKAARLRRAALARAVGPGSAAAAASHFLAAIALEPDAVVSGYWPVGDEFDVRTLLERLVEAGHACGLPVVAGKGKPLVFRRWQPGDVLRPATLGIPVPPPESEEIVPTVALVPLLAFDDRGYRLGYGGGFYDMTIRALRAQGSFTAVGVGFAGQRIDLVPIDDHDERLDWLLTEQGATPVR